MSSPYLLFFDGLPAALEHRPLHQREPQIEDILQHSRAAAKVQQLKGRTRQIDLPVQGELQGFVVPLCPEPGGDGIVPAGG